MRRVLLSARTLLLVAVALVYLPGLSGPFIFDDGPSITRNPHLAIDPAVADEWRTATLSSGSGPFRRPLSMLSFTANYAVTESLEARSIKSTNLAIHLVCGVLVYMLALALFTWCMRSSPKGEVASLSLFVAALWLLAPLHVSTVLYAVQRMAQLATLFVLLGLVVFVRARTRWASNGANLEDLVATSLWVFLCGFLAVLSKENGALILWLIIVIEVALFRGQWNGTENSRLRFLGCAVLLVPVLLVLMGVAIKPELLAGGYASRDFSLEDRLLTQLRLLWLYIGWLVIPDINSMGFQHDDILISQGWLTPVTTVLSAMAWLLVLAVSWGLRDRYPLLLTGILFYLVGHAMESSVWPLEMVYEHRNYLPSVGIFLLLGWVTWIVVDHQRLVRRSILVGTLLAVFTVALLLRVFVWSDELRLTSVNVSNHPESSRSQFFVAQTALRRYNENRLEGVVDESMDEYVLAARHHFEMMYQNDPLSVPALTMLYYMDQRYFPQLQIYRDWFELLLEAANSGALEASDFNALSMLVDCFNAGICGELENLDDLTEVLYLKYPTSVRIGIMRYRFLEIAEAPISARIAFLENLQEYAPSELDVYQLQVNAYYEAEDLSAAMEALLGWLQNDPGRLHLSVIKGVFSENAESPAH